MARSETSERVRGRFGALRLAVLAIGLVLALRVVWIQIVRHEELLEVATGQWSREEATNAERGNLYDRQGRPLALSVTTYQVGAARKLAENREALADLLAEVLDRPRDELRRRILGRGDGHVVLARKAVLTEAQLRRLRREGQGAVTLEDNSTRVYPVDGVAASLIGSFRPDPQRPGRSGLELSLDGYLAGTPGRIRKLRTGKVSRDRGDIVLQPAVHGRSLELTLDTDLQTICEERLAEAVAETRSVSGSVLVMDPSNGDVLAAASWPLMATRARSHADGRVWKNRNFTDLFEPGSVFKIFTSASLLRNAAIDTGTVFNCDNGTDPRVVVENDGGHDYGDLPFMRGFSKSSNVYMAKASFNLRDEELFRDLRTFGFGQVTAAPYPYQEAGALRDPADWSARSKQTIAIGQEVSVTALQLGAALCAVANDGVLYAPRLVRRVRGDATRPPQDLPPVALRRVMAPPLAGLLREAMARVVEEGTGTGACQDWIRTGGKTGTAQKAVPGRGYRDGLHIASFGGLVPVDEPRLVVLAVLDEPQGIHHYAAQSAVPLFRRIVCDIRRSTDWLTDVPGARTAPFVQPDVQRLVQVPDVLYLSTASAAQRLGARELEVAGAERSGLVVQQVPLPGTRCAPGTSVQLTVADATVAAASGGAEPAPDPGLCPDFQGLSNRQVRSLAARLHMPVVVEGVGYAVRQSVRPGQDWSGEAVRVVMRAGGLK